MRGKRPGWSSSADRVHRAFRLNETEFVDPVPGGLRPHGGLPSLRHGVVIGSGAEQSAQIAFVPGEQAGSGHAVRGGRGSSSRGSMPTSNRCTDKPEPSRIRGLLGGYAASRVVPGAGNRPERERTTDVMSKAGDHH